jgi:hypothetical protein
MTENVVFGTVWLGMAAALAGLIAWLRRCRHPNPHYIRPSLAEDPATGHQTVVEPARYECYECGKTWRATVRDAAWAPTRLVQKFSGFDQSRMTRAATRAAIEQEQRTFLAAKRAEPLKAETPAPATRRNAPRATSVVRFNTRRPA